MKHIARWLLWIVGVLYAYGAFVHAMNMVSLTGFDWRHAPRKWQVLDVVYLVLDVVVAVGFFAQWKVSYIAFYVAAMSQIILYTLLRAWIIDVPEVFAVTPEQESYLTTLVLFHVVTLVLVTIALWARRRANTSLTRYPRR